jgi:hypothetical protein
VSVRQAGTWTIAALISPKGAETSWEVWSRSLLGCCNGDVTDHRWYRAPPPAGPNACSAELRFAESAAESSGAWRRAALLRWRLRRRTVKAVASSTWAALVAVHGGSRPRRLLLACRHERRGKARGSAGRACSSAASNLASVGGMWLVFTVSRSGSASATRGDRVNRLASSARMCSLRRVIGRDRA